MGAVADRVDLRGRFGLRVAAVDVGEVTVMESGRQLQRAVRLEVGMGLVDASVGDRPDDVLARGRERGADRIALDRLRRLEDEALDLMVVPDFVDRRGRIGGADDRQAAEPPYGLLGDLGEKVMIGEQRIGDGQTILGREHRRRRERPRRSADAGDLPPREGAFALCERGAARGAILEKLFEQHRPGALDAAGEGRVHFDHDREQLGLRRGRRNALSRSGRRRPGRRRLGVTAALDRLDQIHADGCPRHRLLHRGVGGTRRVGPLAVDHAPPRPIREPPWPVCRPDAGSRKRPGDPANSRDFLRAS